MPQLYSASQLMNPTPAMGNIYPMQMNSNKVE